VYYQPSLPKSCSFNVLHVSFTSFPLSNYLFFSTPFSLQFLCCESASSLFFFFFSSPICLLCYATFFSWYLTFCDQSSNQVLVCSKYFSVPIQFKSFSFFPFFLFSFYMFYPMCFSLMSLSLFSNVMTCCSLIKYGNIFFKESKCFFLSC
jgi:hypothetical protein